jgi:hypothetical protein
MIEFENENERDAWAALTTDQFFAAMIAEGYTALRCHQLITHAMIRFQRRARVQDRRNALRVVDAVKPGDGAAQS